MGRKLNLNAKAKRKIADAFENGCDDAAMRNRQEHLQDWARICGVTRFADIDYSNPIVSLEWQLCDPKILKGLQDPEKRKVFLDGLTEAERHIYYNGYWIPSYPGEVMTEPPVPYSVLEDPQMSKKQLMKEATKAAFKIMLR